MSVDKNGHCVAENCCLGLLQHSEAFTTSGSSVVVNSIASVLVMMAFPPLRQFIPRLRFLLLFFSKVEIRSRALIPLLRQGSVHSGSAS